MRCRHLAVSWLIVKVVGEMGRPRAVHTCAGCGKPTPRRGRARDGVRCVPCSIQRHEESARQISARQGPYYEKWLAGMEKATAARRAEFTGVPADAEVSGTG